METPTTSPGPLVPPQASPPPLPMAATRPASAQVSGLESPVSSGARFEPTELLSGKNLFRVGLGLLLLGLAFLLRYAIDQDWIGEGARIGAGLVTSGVLVGFGLKISKTRHTYGELLQGGGVAGIYLTTFAAHRLYDMIDATTTTVLLGGISAIGIGLAIHAASQRLAIASVLGAIFAPAVVGANLLINLTDAVYLTAVVFVAVVLYFRNEWTLLFWTAQAASASVALAGVAAAIGNQPEGVQTLLVVLWFAFVALPVGASLLGRVADDRPALFGTMVGSLSIGIASWALWSELGDHWGLVSVAATMAIVHIGVALELRSRGLTKLSDLQLVPASVFLAAAIVLAFEGPMVTLALAAEGFALAVAGRRIGNRLMEYLGHGVYSMSGAWLILNMILRGSSDGTPILNGPALSRMAVIGLALGLAALYDTWGDSAADASIKVTYSVAGFVSSLLFFWVELSAVSQGYVSAAWGVVGVAIIVFGTIRERNLVTKTGVATLLGVAVKLFLVDLASVDRIWRISLFFGFGIALLVVGYWMSNDE